MPYDQLVQLTEASLKVLRLANLETYTHCRSVGMLSRLLATRMGLEYEDVCIAELGGYMHDIGKLVVPNKVLNKAGALSAEEFQCIQNHTVWGGDIAINLAGHAPIKMPLKYAARHHHERWDGRGYPDKLGGEDIPLIARLVAIGDVYDTIRAHRVYKSGRSHEEAVHLMRDANRRDGSLMQFDPRMLECFLDHHEEFHEFSVSLNPETITTTEG